MKKLKPCPFCGGSAKFENSFRIEPVIDENGAYIDGDLIYWERTYCPKCDVQFFSDDEDEPEGITIQQWNTRTKSLKHIENNKTVLLREVSKQMNDKESFNENSKSF